MPAMPVPGRLRMQVVVVVAVVRMMAATAMAMAACRPYRVAAVALVQTER